MERASPSPSSSSMASSSSSCDHSLSITSDQTLPYVTSSMLSRTSSCSSSSADVGDYIGTESCFNVLSVQEENDAVSSASEPSLRRFRYGGRRKEEREARAAAAREFPPPIPLLAQTENLLPHMPWVLKRVVTSDGRLILREEKVRHHEYFRAHRSNGRLTLQLVPLNDDVFELPQEPSHYQTDDDDVHEYDDDEEQLVDNFNKGVVVNVPDVDDDNMGNVHGDSEDGCRKYMLPAVTDETVVESGVVVGGGGGGSPRGKCLKSCFVGMRVQEIRPVFS